jgi:biofilm PGA synthesis lipoprotein PgaB
LNCGVILGGDVLMKKAIIFILILFMMVFIASCTKDAPKEEQKNAKIGYTPDNRDYMVPDRPRKIPVLSPPKSFISEAKYDIPADKVYYKGRAVVLTYHHISTEPFSGITIKPERFREDLKMLKDNYFNVISFRDLTEAMDGNIKLPPNAVVITFDDGIESFYKYAFPLLKEYNMPAINFTITSRNESYSASKNDFNPLSPNEIREMYKSGIIDIGSHSHEGHDYTIKNEKGDKGGILAYRTYDISKGSYETVEAYDKRVVDDLEKSRDYIKSYTDNSTDALCFPFGHYNSNLVELSEKAGFKYFVTTVAGYNKENSKSIYIRRIRSGDAKLTPQDLKNNIISCGKGNKS